MKRGDVVYVRGVVAEHVASESTRLYFKPAGMTLSTPVPIDACQPAPPAGSSLDEARQDVVKCLLEDIEQLERENVPALMAIDADEARARQLAALFVREALLSARLGDQLRPPAGAVPAEVVQAMERALLNAEEDLSDVPGKHDPESLASVRAALEALRKARGGR